MVGRPFPEEGILFVISAPSGTGKSTVAHRLVERVPNLEFSVSYTTRPRREGERSGEDYHFVEREEFESMAERGAFLEWARVFDHCYGTGADETRRILAEGRHLLLDIDVQGARQLRESDLAPVSVMLLPPDYRTLERRLKGRGSESVLQSANRLGQARTEAEDYVHFDYVLINDELEGTVSGVEAIIHAERHRTRRGSEWVKRIIATFPS